MLIDWFTVVAQIVNFAILLLLLRRFLYRPILRAMQEREQKIVARLQEAERIQAEADRLAEEYRRKHQEIDTARQQLLTAAREEAERTRAEQLRRIRAETDEVRRRWHHAVQNEKADFLGDLKRRAAAQTHAVMRNALADLAGVDLERHVVRRFVEQLRTLDDNMRRVMAGQDNDAQADPDPQPIIVCSAFELSNDLRQAVEQGIHEHIADNADIARRRVIFTVEPELLCGIELRTPGYKIAWSLESYLDALEEHMSAVFDRLVESHPADAAAGKHVGKDVGHA